MNLNFYDEVKRIQADIAKLPEYYRTLIVAEQSMAQKHPLLLAVGTFLAGAVGMWVFKSL